MNAIIRVLRRPLTLFAYVFFTLLLLTITAPMCAAATYYVAPTGDDNNLGTQTAPFLTIQEGIVSSASGDTVVVEAGTYTGQKNVDLDLDGRNITLTTQSGAAATVIDCGGNSTTSHRGFYLHNGEGAHGTLIINGFTVKNGYESNGPGGGIYMTSSETVTVQNCNFINDYASGNGGGIENLGTLTLINCTFQSNGSGSNGGGLYDCVKSFL